MAMIPTDPLAIELGLLRLDAIRRAQEWNAEAIRIGDLAWDYCDVRGWPKLELTFSGMRFVNDEGEEVEPWR